MIELKHIVKRFDDAVILNDINVTISEGSVTALVGPSGGGKSTLLRCINLLEVPTSGSLSLGGQTLTFEPGRKPSWQAIQSIRRQTGMVFQNFQLFPHQTAIQNVMESLVTVLKWPKAKARERAIIIHGADYADPQFLAREGKLGRSYGCFSVAHTDLPDLRERMGEGRLLYAAA